VDAALESVEGAVRIDLGGLGLAQKLAQVEEMLLRVAAAITMVRRSAALGEVGACPFVDKVLRRHGRIIGDG
jgi:hypothetical protein